MGAQAIDRSIPQQGSPRTSLGIVGRELIDGAHGLVEGTHKALHRGYEAGVTGTYLQGRAATTGLQQIETYPGDCTGNGIAAAGHWQAIDADASILRRLTLGHSARCAATVAQAREGSCRPTYRYGKRLVRSGVGPRQRQTIAGTVINHAGIDARVGAVDRLRNAIQGIVIAVDGNTLDRTTAHLDLQGTSTHPAAGTRKIIGVHTLRLGENDITEVVASLLRVGAGGG